MQDEISILQHLLKDEFISNYEVNSKSSTIPLTLAETNSKLPYNVKIINVPSDCILIKMDKFQGQSSLFKGNHDECKCADYCLVAASKTNGNHIVYIELKHGNSKNKVISQLKGAKCLLEYCKAVVGEYFDDKEFLNDYYEHYVCISNIQRSMKKTPTRITSISNDTPETFLKIEGMCQVHFNRCIQKLSSPASSK